MGQSNLIPISISLGDSVKIKPTNTPVDEKTFKELGLK